MIKKLLTITLCLSSLSPVFSQKYEKIKDSKTKLYGLKEIKSGKVTIQPQYKNLHIYQDSIIFVSSIDGKVGNLSVHGDTLVIFKKARTFIAVFFCGDDSLLHYKNMSYPYQINGKNNGTYKFEIDKNRNCISNDYFPCPPDVPRLEVDDRNKYLEFINQSIKMSTMRQYDSTFLLIQKAINLKPTNPFPYYWMGKIFIDCYENGLTYKNNDPIKEYLNTIEQSLEKADELEKITTRKILIKKVQKKFYQYEKKNKSKVKQIKNNLKKLRKLRNQNCS